MYNHNENNRFLIPFLLGAAITAPFYGKYNKCCNYYPPYTQYNISNYPNYYYGPNYYGPNYYRDRYFVPKPFTPGKNITTNQGFFSPQAPYFPEPYYQSGIAKSSIYSSIKGYNKGNFYPKLNKFISSYLYPYYPIYCKNSPYCYYYGNPYYQKK